MKRAFTGRVALTVLLAVLPAAAEVLDHVKNDAKDTGKLMGHGVAEAGRATGHGVAEAGRATGHGAHKAGSKVLGGGKWLVHKAASGTARGAEKVSEKTAR